MVYGLLPRCCTDSYVLPSLSKLVIMRNISNRFSEYDVIHSYQLIISMGKVYWVTENQNNQIWWWEDMGMLTNFVFKLVSQR